MERPNDLHAVLAQRILSHIRMTQLPARHHLTEQSLQIVLGTSRGPIRSALNYLEKLGFVDREPNRGFFVTPKALAAPELLPQQNDEALYRMIAEDRLAGVLPEHVSERELGARYKVSRHKLSRMLDRIAVEGWIEKRPGHGWGFLSLIDSVKAYKECYELRRMVEPAALLSANFKVDEEVRAALEQQQRFVVDEGHRTLNRIELFEINSRFHELLAGMSGNRFVVQTIARQNQLRRLVEYNVPQDQDRLRRVCGEHLDILVKLKEGRIEAAAAALAEHLDFARLEKTGHWTMGR